MRSRLLPIAYAAPLAMMAWCILPLAAQDRTAVFQPMDVLGMEEGEDGRSEIWLRWMDRGQTAKVTNLTEKRQALAVGISSPPEGADWGPPIRVIDKANHRADGNPGFLRDGKVHLFVVAAAGGIPRKLTTGPYDHTSPAKRPDGRSLLVPGNRGEDVEHEPLDSETYRVDVSAGEFTKLTDRYGPDRGPQPSPTGDPTAYTGFDDEHLGFQTTELSVMNANGSGSRRLTADFDRSVASLVWPSDGSGFFFSYDDEGNGKVGFLDAQGQAEELVENVQGLSTGRPYSGGQFSVAPNGRIAFTFRTPSHPAELAVDGVGGGGSRRLTDLNSDLLGHLELGAVEEIWYESSFDRRRIQGRIVKPPGFEASKKNPLILEVPGGPFAKYGVRFAAELQLYAAPGYVVLYTNPKGSTSYGKEFGNLIHHAYPGRDYDDLMSGVDAVIARGYLDEGQLFVTGGSGGGALSFWIVGHTDRFRAAVVQKPVINWYSFVLHADGPGFFHKYWFPGPPWEHMERSPLSFVGDVTTSTMPITGELDYWTPRSESEQYFAGLQIKGVPSMLVRVPDAHHGIAPKPSNLIAKVQHILAWFEKWREGSGGWGAVVCNRSSPAGRGLTLEDH